MEQEHETENIGPSGLSSEEMELIARNAVPLADVALSTEIESDQHYINRVGVRRGQRIMNRLFLTRRTRAIHEPNLKPEYNHNGLEKALYKNAEHRLPVLLEQKEQLSRTGTLTDAEALSRLSHKGFLIVKNYHEEPTADSQEWRSPELVAKLKELQSTLGK